MVEILNPQSKKIFKIEVGEISKDNHIEIISSELCLAGLKALVSDLKSTVRDIDKAIIIPVKEGGSVVGEFLSTFTEIKTAPMWMNNYDEDDNRLDEPECRQLPDFNKLIDENGKAKKIFFAEAVVDSQGTILKAIEVLNAEFDKKGIERPVYSTYALVSKTDGNVLIPGLKYAFKVHKDIWIYGMGCDTKKGFGRLLDHIRGFLSPKATESPQKPYFSLSTLFKRRFIDATIQF